MEWITRSKAHPAVSGGAKDPEMFNDAYDRLPDYFGDAIDAHFAQDEQGDLYYDISIKTSTEHPYAVWGDDDTNTLSQTNQELKSRTFYRKAKET
jgi:hypothetical protein